MEPLLDSRADSPVISVHILPVPPVLQPAGHPVLYPKHNKDYGVEQDFLRSLTESGEEMLTSNSDEADWHFLPAFWTRWHLNHDYAKQGREELQREVDRVVIDPAKTFTVCQYDDGPLVDLGNAPVFLASRQSQVGHDIPLLCAAHRAPRRAPRTRYRAAFVGRLWTHALRQEMADALEDRQDVLIYDGDRSTRFFVRRLLSAEIALCPRGYGGSSFRLFEAMQMARPPLLLSDVDTRPFRRVLPWDDFSFYAARASDLPRLIDERSSDELAEMGRRAHRVWREELTYGRWWSHVIDELAALQSSSSSEL